MITQKVIQIELIVALSANCILAVHHQRIAIGFLSFKECITTGHPFAQRFQIVQIEPVEVAFGHSFQRYLVFYTIVGYNVGGREHTNTVAVQRCGGLIIGSPNYLGDVTAGFRALFERLIYQSLTYETEFRSYNQKQIPVLMIMTSNASEDFYAQIGYDAMLQRYQGSFLTVVGPTKILISSDTLQVKDYSRYNWTMFNPEHKKERHETVFPEDKKKAFALGEQMVNGTWE